VTTKTYRLRGGDIDSAWHVIDASGRPLGRVASEVAQLLLGKHKPTYEPHLAMGDHVVVVNAGKVAISGNKAQEKVYYRHSGYPGHLKERTFEEQMARDPRRVIERAVKGMLPHNSRGRQLFRHLRVYAGAAHPHAAQFNAGTSARAQRRAAAEAAEPVATAETTAPAVEEPETTSALEAAVAEAASERLSGSLNGYRREELDAEATRLGITIEDGWNKPDVVAAIEAFYEANPEPEGSAASE
jgi:large subunit ribosomal protein L13